MTEPATKPRSLDAFTDLQLAEEIRRRFNSKAGLDDEAQTILVDEFGDDSNDDDGGGLADPIRLEEARARILRGDIGEALYELSVALGPDFSRFAEVRLEGAGK